MYEKRFKGKAFFFFYDFVPSVKLIKPIYHVPNIVMSTT